MPACQPLAPMLRLVLVLLLGCRSAAFLAPSAPLTRSVLRASAGDDSQRSSRPPARTRARVKRSVDAPPSGGIAPSAVDAPPPETETEIARWYMGSCIWREWRALKF